MLEKKSTDPIDWLTADLAGIPLNLSILKAGQSFRYLAPIWTTS